MPEFQEPQYNILYQKYLNKLWLDEHRPSIEEFKNEPDYSENKARLEHAKAGIAMSNTKNEAEGKGRSKENTLKEEVFENVLIMDAKKIFGENTEGVPASKFDDVLNKIDEILEIKEGDKILRLGIDSTLGGMGHRLDDKIKGFTKKRIKDRQTLVRYHKSMMEPDVKGKIENLPRVVLGIPNEDLEYFISATKDKENLPDIQRVMFSYIKTQLDNQFIYALLENKTRIGLQEIDKRKDGTTLVLRKKHQEIVDQLYTLAKDARSGQWENMNTIMELLTTEQETFKKENVMMPNSFKFLYNIKDLWLWANAKLGEENENAVPIEGTASNEFGAHWKSEDFE